MDTTFVLLLLLAFILIITFSVIQNSQFGNVQEIMEDQYPPNNCYKEGRLTPSGHLPGSWIMLTDQERKEMLKTFVENWQHI